MRWMAALLILGLAGGCSKTDESTQAPEAGVSTNQSSSGNPLTAPTDYLGAVATAQKNSINTLELTNLRQAVRAFEAGEGRNPGSLKEIVDEGYLPRMPAAPNGMKFSYDPADASVSLVPVE